MVWRRASIALLVTVLASLLPLAEASPPDQTWLGGFYDDADYDDVVLSVTSTVATADTNPIFDVGPIRIVVGALTPAPQPPAPARVPTTQRPRSPPAS